MADWDQRMDELERRVKEAHAKLEPRVVDNRVFLPTWTIAGLTAAAYAIAIRTDDCSLVGLAARSRDTVVLAATRESVVLYGPPRNIDQRIPSAYRVDRVTRTTDPAWLDTGLRRSSLGARVSARSTPRSS
jgi:hypothetical protein